MFIWSVGLVSSPTVLQEAWSVVEASEEVVSRSGPERDDVAVVGSIPAAAATPHLQAGGWGARGRVG